MNNKASNIKDKKHNCFITTRQHILDNILDCTREEIISNLFTPTDSIFDSIINEIRMLVYRNSKTGKWLM